MAFIHTWNAPFEGLPGDTEDASQGASRIRDLKVAISERMKIDHLWPGDATDGEHKQVTLGAPLGADPSTVANKGYLYTKDVNSVVELFWKDENGNVLQLTSLGELDAIPSGSKMVFIQNIAPIGWTFATGYNDRVLKMTDTVGDGDTLGGSWTISGLTNAGTSLSVAQMAAHVHKMFVDVQNGTDLAAGNATDQPVREKTTGGDSGYRIQATSGAATLGETESRGSGATHTHAISSDGTWKPLHVEAIVCTKD